MMMSRDDETAKVIIDEREDRMMRLAHEVGYFRQGQAMALDELRIARDECKRLRAVISHAVVELENGVVREEVTERLADGARGIVTCKCGLTLGHDQVSWRDWPEMGIQVGECSCGSTVSRVMAK